MSEPVNVADLFRLWSSGESVSDIALALGISQSMLYRLKWQYGLPSRQRGGVAFTIVDPSPEEIAERAAVERSRWSEDERHRRIVGNRHVRWTAPAFRYDGRYSHFTPVVQE